jgi:predicted nucleotide-binding protein
MAEDTKELSVRERLRHLIDLDFERTTLDNVLKYIAEVTKLKIVIDPDMAAGGIDLSTRVVDLNVAREPVESVLDLILGSDLAYQVRPGHVLVSPRSKVLTHVSVRAYPLGATSLTKADDPRTPAMAVGIFDLIAVIQRTVNALSDPNVAPWADEGGSGTIEFINGKLVVGQTDRAHEKIASLLWEICPQGTTVLVPPHTPLPEAPSCQAQASTKAGVPSAEANPQRRSTVFIVHGHDPAAKEELARFIHKLDLQPIILDEQPDRSTSAMEKLEEAAPSVDFAVVLLTPDDLGASRQDLDSRREPGEKVAGLKPRGRQNVLLELGYYVGRLGRQRVFVLRKGGLEIVSDFSDWHGIICKEMDSHGGWKQKLCQVLKAAGFQVDLNKAFE